jgi:hypothetical protein
MASYKAPPWNSEIYYLFKHPNIVGDIKIGTAEWAGNFI